MSETLKVVIWINFILWDLYIILKDAMKND